MTIGIGVGLQKLPFRGNKFFGEKLFAGGEDGFYFEFGKTDRMWKETLGTTQIALDSDPIGLALEQRLWNKKSFAETMAAQAERVVNGGFDVDANWNTNGSSVTISGGKGIMTGVASGGLLTQTVPPARVAGNWYTVGYDIVDLTAGNFAARFENSTGRSLGIGVGWRDFFLSNGATNLLGVRAAGLTTGAIDNFTSKLVPGSHAYQGTTTARPLWKTPNFIRFDGSDDALITGAILSAAAGFIGCRINQSVGNNGKAIMGARSGSSSGAAWFNITGVGVMGGKVGDGSAAGVVGTTNVANRWVNLGIGWSGGTFRFYVDGAVDSPDYALTGSPAALAMALGAINQAGVNTAFGAFDMAAAIQINREPSPAELVKLSNYWKTLI